MEIRKRDKLKRAKVKSASFSQAILLIAKGFLLVSMYISVFVYGYVCLFSFSL